MTALSPEVRKLLELEPDAQLVPAGHMGRPEQPVAFGKGLFISHHGSDSRWADELRTRLAEEPFCSPVSWHERDLPCRLKRWDRDPCVVILNTDGIGHVRLAGPHARLSAREFALDGRREDAWARICSDLEDLLFQCSGGSLQVFVVLAASRVDEGTEPEVPSPDIPALSCGLKLEAWLVALATDMSRSPRPLTRVAAAGLVARLWSAADRDAQRIAWAHLTSDQEGPSAKALRWFRLLASSARERVERSALHEVDALEDRLPELAGLLRDDPEQVAALGRSWLHRRDDLECIRFLCKRTDSGAEIERALSALDERAGATRSLWMQLPLQDDDRLWSVSWQEPDHWWGQLVALERERE